MSIIRSCGTAGLQIAFIFLIPLLLFHGLFLGSPYFNNLIVRFLELSFQQCFAGWAAFLSFIGLGYAVLRFSPIWQDMILLRTIEKFLLFTVTGMLSMSLLLFMLGLFGLLHPLMIKILRNVFAGIGLLTSVVLFIERTSAVDRAPDRDKFFSLFLLFLMILCVSVFFLGAITSPQVHPDALQYHFGLPQHFARTGSLGFYPTIFTSGIYFGGDILFVLTQTRDGFHTIYASKLLSLLTGGIFFTSIYCVSRRAGASQSFAALAVVLLFSVDAIQRWGTGKNDLLSAGLSLTTMWIFLLTNTFDSRRWLPVLGLVAGYAISVKIHMVVPVAVVIIWLLLQCKFRAKERLSVLVAACVPVIPWALFAYYYRKTPFYPFGFELSPYVEAAWVERNANGLELGLSSYVENIVPLVLDLDQRVSGNDSLGVLFLLFLAISLVIFVFRWRNLDSVFLFSGVVFFLLFSVTQFEGRFLNRYILFVPASIFTYVVVSAPDWLRTRTVVRRLALGIIPLVAVLWGPIPALAKKVWADQNRSEYVSGVISNHVSLERTYGKDYLEMIDYVNEHVHGKGKVLINDGYLFFLDVPFYNAHMLHNYSIQFDRLTVSEFAQVLRHEGACIALIRHGISGITPTLFQYLDRYVLLLRRTGRVELYTCRDGSPRPEEAGAL